MEENQQGEALWRFASNIWGNAGLRHVLITAQDKHALDIPLCIFALFCSQQQRQITHDSPIINTLSDTWQVELISNIRELRNRYSDNTKIKEKLLAAELEAEKQYLNELAQLFGNLPLSAGDTFAALKNNISATSDYAWSEAELDTLLEVIK